MNTPYNILAPYYDTFVGEREADNALVQSYILAHATQTDSIIDLACGTGMFLRYMPDVSCRLGVDIEPEMITRARRFSDEITFQVGDMKTYQPSHSFDVVTCLFDSINHLTNEADWKLLFSNIANMMHDDSVFIFDMNTAYKLRHLSEMGTFDLVTDNSTTIGIKVVAEEKHHYTWRLRITDSVSNTSTETQIPQYAPSVQKVLAMLQKHFVEIHTYDTDPKATYETIQRVYFVCKKKASQEDVIPSPAMSTERVWGTRSVQLPYQEHMREEQSGIFCMHLISTQDSNVQGTGVGDTTNVAKQRAISELEERWLLQSVRTIPTETYILSVEIDHGVESFTLSSHTTDDTEHYCRSKLTSSGLAVHSTYFDALSHAVCEVCEHDSLMIVWLLGITPPRIDITSAPKNIRYRVQSIIDTSYQLTFFDISLDKQASHILVTVEKNDTVVYVGTACRITTEEAFDAALREVEAYVFFGNFFDVSQQIHFNSLNFLFGGKKIAYSTLEKRVSLKECMSIAGSTWYATGVHDTDVHTSPAVRVYTNMCLPLLTEAIDLRPYKTRLKHIANTQDIADPDRTIDYNHPFSI